MFGQTGDKFFKGSLRQNELRPYRDQTHRRNKYSTEITDFLNWVHPKERLQMNAIAK